MTSPCEALPIETGLYCTIRDARFGLTKKEPASNVECNRPKWLPFILVSPARIPLDLLLLQRNQLQHDEIFIVVTLLHGTLATEECCGGEGRKHVEDDRCLERCYVSSGAGKPSEFGRFFLHLDIERGTKTESCPNSSSFVVGPRQSTEYGTTTPFRCLDRWGLMMYTECFGGPLWRAVLATW